MCKMHPLEGGLNNKCFFEFLLCLLLFFLVSFLCGFFLFYMYDTGNSLGGNDL